MRTCQTALHWKTKEGLVRGVRVQTAGFAMSSCLAEREGLENN